MEYGTLKTVTCCRRVGKLLGEEYRTCINRRLTQNVSVIKEKINLPWDKDTGRIAL
jgi:hypothetical protein